jgi:hypothetical protein
MLVVIRAQENQGLLSLSWVRVLMIKIARILLVKLER